MKPYNKEGVLLSNLGSKNESLMTKLFGFLIFFLILFSVNSFSETICQKIPCKVQCEDLSDNFCDYLWNDQNLGNVHFNSSQKILIGKTSDELVSYIELNNLLSLIKNKCSLPSEVKKVLKVDCTGKKKDWFDKFYNFLNEREGVEGRLAREKWKWKLNDFKTRFDRAESLAANQRTLKKYPNLKNKIWNDLLDKDRKLYMEDYFDIKSEVLLAKYSNHENYLRAQKLFHEVVEDLLHLVSSLKISKEQKDLLVEKIKRVEFVLPFQDPRSIGASQDCTNKKQNAYYLPSKNLFTICGGYLNGYFVDGHIYRVMAHEISHAIDPQQLAQDAFKISSLAKLLGEVYVGNGNLECHEWEQRSQKELVVPDKFWKLPNKIEEISRCLGDNKELNQLTFQSLDVPTDIFTSKKIHQYANSKLFTFLARPQIIKKGILVNNQFYLNPLLVEARNNDYIFEQYYSKGYFHIGAVFTQNFRCIEESDSVKKFNTAIQKTEEMFKTYKKTLFSYIGRNDEYLQFHDLAQPVDESWADWMAANSMRVKLKRMSSQEEKNIFALSTQAKFCGKNGLERLSASHLRIEKNYSKEVHPLKRSRRLSYFLDEFSGALGCTPGEEIKRLAASCPDLTGD